MQIADLKMATPFTGSSIGGKNTIEIRQDTRREETGGPLCKGTQAGQRGRKR
jgi:hypothetical protein